MALLTVLVRLGYPCVAAHCNFHLRGEESDRDAAFAAAYAASIGVPFYQAGFDTAEYAAYHHLSIEMAARELRYRWFEELRASVGAQAIAVAHHRDDSVETLLLNLVRGTGIRGMAGIRPRNGYVVRPLLDLSREEIVNWLAAQQIAYMTDSTNLSDQYTRNFIRLRVLPLLEELNPSVKTAIARTAAHLSAAETIYLQTIEKAKEEVMATPGRLSIDALMQFPEPAAILYELLQPYQVSRPLAEDIFRSLAKIAGKEFFSPVCRFIKDRDYLLIAPLQAEEKTSYVLTPVEGSWEEPIRLSARLEEVSPSFMIEKEKTTGCFDLDKLQLPLVLRRWTEGDWFIPFGMKGRKKLSDYFSDHKFSRLQKEHVWLLCSGNDIVWIVGERADHRFRIEESTKHALIMKFFG